jgi:hypothetical protein
MVMHGLIRLGPTGESIIVRGLLNWYAPASLLPLSVFLSGSGGIRAIVAIDLLYSGMLVLVYLTQMALYKQLAAVIVEQGFTVEEEAHTGHRE